MVRIAPIRLVFNPKTLWFDAGTMELGVGDDVIVTTARGTEFGQVVSSIFDMDDEEAKQLKSPLKPVKRLATDDDRDRTAEMFDRSREAMPTFRQLAEETVPDMNPVAVEFMFDGDKAVFYFEAEDRVDFRDLVRKLASEFHVRVDMKQIGVRDEARLIGGLGHCGQELCCRRMGGDFNPVSIRMAKEQNLSLNPEKISGTCGRLMCCLRYEYEAYKDFHTRAPKKNAKIQTPDGEGKVVDLDVPREIVSIQVGTDKPIKVPLADMDTPEEGGRPTSIGADAWTKAKEPPITFLSQASSLFSVELTGEDKLAEPGSVHHVHGEKAAEQSKRTRRKRQGSGAQATSAEQAALDEKRKSRRRRSTTVSSDGSTTSSKEPKDAAAAPAASDAAAAETEKSAGKRRRSRRGGRGKSAEQKAAAKAAQQPAQQSAGSKVGRKSSALRARHAQAESADGQVAPSAGDAQEQASGEGQPRRRPRRRRARKVGGQGAEGAQNAGSASSPGSSE